MMDDQNEQAPAVKTDDQQTAPVASPAPALESVEKEKTDSDEQAVA